MALVVVDTSGVAPDSAHSVVFDALMAAVERQESFAAVVRMPEAPPRGRPTFATDDPTEARTWALARLEDA